MLIFYFLKYVISLRFIWCVESYKFLTNAPFAITLQMTTRQARKAKGVYGKWKEENLQLALVAISEGVDVNEAARRYNIPSATLKRYNKRKDAKIRQRKTGPRRVCNNYR